MRKATYTKNPETAKKRLDELVATGEWSEATMKPTWLNAKRELAQLERDLPIAQGNAQKIYERDIPRWKAVIKRIEDNITPGALVQWTRELSDEMDENAVLSAAISGAESVGVKTRTKLTAEKQSQKTLLGVLTNVFGGDTAFTALAGQTQALYALLWDLTPAERISLVTSLLERESGRGVADAKMLNARDKSQISSWFLELFRQTYELAERPGELVFVGHYFHPSVLRHVGQEMLLRLIHHLFDTKGVHSGGVSSSLRLRRPNWDRIGALNTAIADAFRGKGVIDIPRPSPMMVSDDLDDDDDDESPADVDYGDPSPPSPGPRLIAIPHAPISDAVEFREMDGLSISENFVSTAIYGRRLAAALEPWMVSNQRSVPASLDDQHAIDEESKALGQLRTDYTDFTQRSKKLLDTVDAEREAKRVLMSDEMYNDLKSDLDSLKIRFVGLYRGKADLLEYLQRQLTGSRPRPVTANNIVATGEPGTGKTTLMEIVAYMMIELGLIDSPTLETYELVGRTLERSTTSAEYDKLSSAPLPNGVPDKIAPFLRGSTLFALRASSSMTGGQTRASPGIYDPGKFESPFEGGQVAQFLLAVFRGLGSALIIDEAYGLSADRYRSLVDQLVALITQLGTQWSTALLGYEDAMKAFFASGNEGLERRYDTTIRFGHYSAMELVAILARLLITADNLVFAESEETVHTIAMRESADDVSVTNALHSVLTALYNEMAPFAMRGSRRGYNLFGASNVGAVQKLFGLVGSSYTEEFNSEPTLALVTPSKVGDALKKTAEDRRTFGSWTTTRDYARDKPKA